jgi:hypothetical protein
VPGAAQYSTSPSGINEGNEVAGYYADASGVCHGFLKQYGTYTTVDVRGAADTFFDGINNRAPSPRAMGASIVKGVRQIGQG